MSKTIVSISTRSNGETTPKSVQCLCSNTGTFSMTGFLLNVFRCGRP